MNHDPAVRQRETLTLGARGEQYRRHAGGLTDAISNHVALEETDGVVDRHAPGDNPAGRVDIQMNILFGIFHLEEQKLRNHDIGHAIIDGRANKDNAVFQQAGIDVHRPLDAAVVFNHHRNVITHG